MHTVGVDQSHDRETRGHLPVRRTREMAKRVEDHGNGGSWNLTFGCPNGELINDSK